VSSTSERAWTAGAGLVLSLIWEVFDFPKLIHMCQSYIVVFMCGLVLSLIWEVFDPPKLIHMCQFFIFVIINVSRQ